MPRRDQRHPRRRLVRSPSARQRRPGAPRHRVQRCSPSALSSSEPRRAWRWTSSRRADPGLVHACASAARPWQPRRRRRRGCALKPRQGSRGDGLSILGIAHLSSLCKPYQQGIRHHYVNFNLRYPAVVGGAGRRLVPAAHEGCVARRFLRLGVAPRADQGRPTFSERGRSKRCGAKESRPPPSGPRR